MEPGKGRIERLRRTLSGTDQPAAGRASSSGISRRHRPEFLIAIAKPNYSGRSSRLRGQSKQFLGPVLGVGAILLLGATIFSADRLGAWVWAVVAISIVSIAGLSAGLEPVRRAARAGLGAAAASMAEWWDSIGPERRPAEPQQPDSPHLDAPRERRGPVHEAQTLLESLLADGPVKSVDVYRVASEDGISRRTLQRAKTRLGVKVRRITYGNEGKGYWMWQLSNGATETSATPAIDGRSSSPSQASETS